MPAKLKLDQLILATQNIFLSQLSKQQKSASKSQTNFSKPVVELVTGSVIRGRMLAYLSYKNEELFNENVTSSFINTPHPIGNLSANQGIYLDIICRLLAAELRISMNQEAKDKNPKYENPDQYRSENLSKIKEYILRHQDIFNLTENDFKLINSPEVDHNVLLTILAEKFIAAGIATNVVSREQQSQDSANKTRHLLSRLSKESANGAAESKNYLDEKRTTNKTWEGVDGDGDAQNSMLAVISDLEGKKLKEIYIHTKEKKLLAHPPLAHYETRISCKNKVGVKGVSEQLKSMPGVNQINSIDDILVNFDGHYEAFKQYFESLKYPKDDAINSPLDFIMRIAMPAFADADSMVLSDFPVASGKEILLRLLFVKKAMEKYLGTAIPQKFLPLCEDEADIDGLLQVVSGLMQDINQSAASSQNKDEITQLFTIQKEGKKEFVFGGFFGPSDLTADMGSMALIVINNKSCELEELCREFQKNNPEFSEVDFVQEYGKGTSPKRGGNYVLKDLTRTVQGLTPAALDTQLNKHYARNISNQSSILPVDSQILEQAVEFHRHILSNDAKGLGLIAREYNDLIKDSRGQKLFAAIDKKFANNQGTRGKAGLTKFEDQRAIPLATITSYIGLLQSPFLPYDATSGTIKDFDIKEFINHPAGMAVFIAELYQFCAMDYERAKLLGFSDEAINLNKNYLKAAAEFFTEKFREETKEDTQNNDQQNINQQNGDKRRKTQEESPDLESIAQRVKFFEQIIDKATSKIEANYLQKRLQLFKEQAPLIANISAVLTAQTKDLADFYDQSLHDQKEEINGGIEDDKPNEMIAQIATSLNFLANFQLPTIASSIPKTADISQENSSEISADSLDIDLGDEKSGDELSHQKSATSFDVVNDAQIPASRINQPSAKSVSNNGWQITKQ